MGANRSKAPNKPPATGWLLRRSCEWEESDRYEWDIVLGRTMATNESRERYIVLRVSSSPTNGVDRGETQSGKLLGARGFSFERMAANEKHV